MERRLELGVRFAAERHRAVVAGEGADVRDQRLDARAGYVGRAGMLLERLVDLAHVRDLARLHRQVVAHEAVEVRGVRLLPEVHFHRPPVVLVELGLKLRLQPHQDEVADQVAWLSSRPVEFMLSKMSCGLSWSRLSEMSTITSFASPLQSAAARP